MSELEHVAPRAPAPKLLTLPEAAVRTRVPEGTLRRWRCVGTGPTSGLVGRRVVYRESDLEAWLDTQLAATATVRRTA